MNEDELLQVYGIEPDKEQRESIRRSLQQEMENQKIEDHEVLKLLCIMLFAIGSVEDTELIWQAKRKIRTQAVTLMCRRFAVQALKKQSCIWKKGRRTSA